MKRSAFIILATAFFFSGFADEWANSFGSCYVKGNMNVSGGLSVLHLGVYGLFDYAIHDAISVGAELGYNQYAYNSFWRYNYVPVAIRGSFHPFNVSAWSDKITIRDKLDPYAGISMGWNAGWATWRGIQGKLATPSTGGFVFRENIGVRFYPISRFYFNFEEGGGLGLFNFGVGFKL
jgi:hypothetical protein